MSLAAQLRQKLDAYAVARDAWVENENNPNLTTQERQEFLDARDSTMNNLNNITDLIRQQERLDLASVDEAKAFVAVLPDVLRDRGNLTGVRICNVNSAIEREMCLVLENAGLTLQEIRLTFSFPPA